jgi:hypothetical protein
MPPEEAATSDQLLYSVMSNQSLLRWVRDYSIQTKGVVPARSQFVGDFSRAVVNSGGDHVVLALTKASVGKQNVFDSLEALLPVIFATFNDRLGGIMGQTEMSTVHTKRHRQGQQTRHRPRHRARPDHRRPGRAVGSRRVEDRRLLRPSANRL